MWTAYLFMVIDLRQETISAAVSPATNTANSPAYQGFTVTLQHFEGPLDLLLQMIRGQEIDIYDIPIARVTNQYLFHLRQMEHMDLDVAGDYIVMAATLLEIKSKLLLPKPPPPDAEEGPDPREELVLRLLEYEKYKEVAGLLHDQEETRRLLFARTVEIDPHELPALPAEGVGAIDLLNALKRVLESVGEITEPITTIPRQKITLRMKMTEMVRRVRDYGGSMPFSLMFAEEHSRTAVVMAFLALLELIRQFKVWAEQGDHFGEILISTHKESESEGERAE